MAVVVITGCSSGFGYESALAFARRGDRVYATMRNPAKGDLATRLADEGLDAEVIRLDVDDDASARSALGDVLDREGKVDVLVNNAGIGGQAGAIEELTDADWTATISTNLLGPIRCTRAVLPSMRAAGSGVIVNVSSTAGRLPGTPITSTYAASKHALCAMTDSLWTEVEPFGIRVQCIEPGFFATSVLANSGTDAHTDSAYAELHAAVLRWYETSMAGAPPPDPVVDAIVAAADGTLPEDTIHHPIGADAELFLGGMATMSYAEFRALGQQMLGIA